MKSNLELRPFQEHCIWQMINAKRGLIALPTGTGKTITSLSIYTYFKHKIPSLKLLYITDKTLIKQTYSQDLFTYFKGLKANYVYDNNKQERKQIYSQWVHYNDILIINYHTLRTDFELFGHILRDIDRNFITILDEATAFKNTTSQINQCVSKLTRASRRTYALTATPGTSGLYDIFNILTAIQLSPYKNHYEFEYKHCDFQATKMILFKSGSTKRVSIPQPEKGSTTTVTAYFSLRKAFKINKPMKIMSKPNVGWFSILNDANGSFRWRIPNQLTTKTNITALAGSEKLFISASIFDNKVFNKYKNIKLFKEKTSEYMFIRSKKDIASELPPVNVIYRYCDETDEVKRAVKKIYESEKYSASQVEIATMAPQAYSNEFIDTEPLSGKMASLLYYLENDIPNEKCIIFFPYTKATDIIKRTLQDHFHQDVIYVHGQTPDRDGELQKFLSSDRIRFLVGTATILKGLNLQQIDNIAVLHPTYTFGNYLQLIGRINRLGGTNNTKTIVHFITRGTRDEDMLESILQQGVVTYKFDKRLVDDGVIPEKYLQNKNGMTEQQAKEYLDKQLEARRANYFQ